MNDITSRLTLPTKDELAESLRDEVNCLRRHMAIAQKMLEVPAAEYVPAINDAWEELERGLAG